MRADGKLLYVNRVDDNATFASREDLQEDYLKMLVSWMKRHDLWDQFVADYPYCKEALKEYEQ